jgi:YggT family protein
VETVFSVLLNFFNLYRAILMARILLSWFPVRWDKQPMKFIHDATEPVMEPFRKILPPLGGLDLSPILLFMVLGIVTQLLAGVAG